MALTLDHSNYAIQLVAFHQSARNMHLHYWKRIFLNENIHTQKIKITYVAYMGRQNTLDNNIQ